MISDLSIHCNTIRFIIEGYYKTKESTINCNIHFYNLIVIILL